MEHGMRMVEPVVVEKTHDGVRRVEQVGLGMRDAVPAVGVKACSAPARHDTERIEQAVQTASARMAAVEARVYQEPTAPAGLPEIAAVAASVHLKWREVVALVRRLAH